MKMRFTDLYFKAITANNFPMFVITHNTRDFGDKYCLRLHVVERSTKNQTVTVSEEYALASTLEGIRDIVPNDCVYIPRDPNDDPVIVETWI